MGLDHSGFRNQRKEIGLYSSVRGEAIGEFCIEKLHNLAHNLKESLWLLYQEHTSTVWVQMSKIPIASVQGKDGKSLY